MLVLVILPSVDCDDFICSPDTTSERSCDHCYHPPSMMAEKLPPLIKTADFIFQFHFFDSPSMHLQEFNSSIDRPPISLAS